MAMGEALKQIQMSSLADVVEATASTGRKIMRLFHTARSSAGSSSSAAAAVENYSKDIDYSPTTISSTSDSCSTTTSTFFDESVSCTGRAFPKESVAKLRDPFEERNVVGASSRRNVVGSMSYSSSPFLSGQRAMTALRNECAIIVDWDDTLFPSSWLQNVYAASAVSPSVSAETSLNGMQNIFDASMLSVQDVHVLRLIERSVLELLREMVCHGEVYIMTNAESGWVQFSASMFMPDVYRFLADEEIPIVSARSCFSKMKLCPTTYYGTTFADVLTGENMISEESPEPDQWKAQTLSLLLQSFMQENTTTYQMPNQSNHTKEFHFISIGDSDCERRALLACREQYYQRGFFKSIKLIENPDPSQLKRQLDYLRKFMTNLRTVPDCVDIVFENNPT